MIENSYFCQLQILKQTSRLRKTHCHPNTKMLANNSAMNKQLNTRLTMPRAFCTSCPSFGGTRPSHVSSCKMRSVKMAVTSSDTNSSTL